MVWPVFVLAEYVMNHWVELADVKLFKMAATKTDPKNKIFSIVSGLFVCKISHEALSRFE